MRDEDSQVVRPRDFEAIAAFMDPAKLELNMGIIAQWRAAEVVETPGEADVVFADDYVAKEVEMTEDETPKPAQVVIRSFDVEKLAMIANA
jgi:hypothetical protein